MNTMQLTPAMGRQREFHMLKRVALLFMPLAFLLTFYVSNILASPTYNIEIMAANGQGGLTTISRYVSINDSGKVAFVGRRAGGENMFVASGPSLFNKLRSVETSSVTFAQTVQINNFNQVLARDLVAATPGNPARTRIRVWDGNSIDTNVIIARGGLSEDFDAIVTNSLSINNKGDPVFVGLHGTQSFLSAPKLCIIPGPNGIVDSLPAEDDIKVGGGIIGGDNVKCDTSILAGDDIPIIEPGEPSGFYEIPLTIPLRPIMADNGCVAVRAGNNSTSPIRLLDMSGFSGCTGISGINELDIANTSMGFVELGQRPGISDDGSMVVFYGDLSANGANALGIPSGKGIFISIRIPNIGWVIHRVVGLGGDAQFSAFDPNGRVAVNNTRTIAYTAFDSTGNKGIYVSQVGFFLIDTGGHQRFLIDDQPLLIKKQGDIINGSGSITDIELHDPINNRGDLAFWVNTSNGTTSLEAVVRAKRDCAEANYNNPQTATYINQYDAGDSVGLPLSSRGGTGALCTTPAGTWNPKRGGNACGPSSLTMVVNAAKRSNSSNQRLDLTTMYLSTMACFPSLDDYLNNSFLFNEGLADVISRGYTDAKQIEINDADNARAKLDDLLDQGKPVVAGTRFGMSSWGNLGGGHVVLFLGRTAFGDYIVNDPAGNYFSSNTGHYGQNKCGELAIYPKSEIDNLPAYLKLTDGRMLVVPPQPTADPKVLLVSFKVIGSNPSPIALWLENGDGDLTGFLPDGTTIKQISNSEVHTEVITTTDPESSIDDEAGQEKTTSHSILIVTPDATTRAYVHGFQSTNYELEIRNYENGLVDKTITTGIVTAGVTQQVNLSGQSQVNVPNVVNQTQSAAQTALTDAGLIVGTVTQKSSNTVLRGSVISQNPAAEVPVAAGSTVDLVVSSGPPPIIPGDINGDGVANCADITIVKASFGKKTGKPGFDVRADVNKDGVVDVRDLSFVSRQLPAGTKCS